MQEREQKSKGVREGFNISYSVGVFFSSQKHKNKHVKQKFYGASEW